MTPREFTEQSEHQLLCEFAAFSDCSKGRLVSEEKDDLRTDFCRDRDRIIHARAFRRLKHKTQVYLAPSGDHYRTRLTHTLEVSQIARTVSRALRLNEDLTEAIALGHDLGHTPFGHAGERVLNELCECGFSHYFQGLRVVDYLEKDGKGLNLTYEVRDGILKHTNMTASTREGQIVRLADVIAYMNHDIEDSICAGILKESDIPNDIRRNLGESKSQRITTLVSSIIKNGAQNPHMSEEVQFYHDKLKAFMFERVYTNPVCKSEEIKAQQILRFLYEYFYNHKDLLPKEYLALSDKFGFSQCVCDYIAGMTDIYAIDMFERIFLPSGWKR